MPHPTNTRTLSKERAKLEKQRTRDQRAYERIEARREIARLRAEYRAERRARRHAATARLSRAAVLAVPNVAVNAIAVIGQVLALTSSLGWPWYAAAPIALAIESVAINIGYYAHHRLLHGESAWTLRALAHTMGIAVGWLNYTHTTPDLAIVCGGASVLSPILWQIYSQWRSREKMRAEGLLEPRAPRFGKLRWLIPSLRGETWAALKLAVAEGIQSPAVALAVLHASQAYAAGVAAAHRGRTAAIDTHTALTELAVHLYAQNEPRTSARTEDPAHTSAHAGTDPRTPAHAGTDTRTPAHADTAPRTPARRGTGKKEFARRLSDEIIKAAERGDRWAPDYAHLMQISGMSRSWCEKRVREARLLASTAHPRQTP